MKPFIFPPALLAQHSAFIGKTGSGKTSTAKLAVEQIVRDDPTSRVCVLDPIKSDWWGLISSADGKRPGLPFQILGGPRGHVKLHDSAGKVIGELVGRGELPLSIVDMAEFEAGGLQRFFNDFVPALMRHMRGVLTLVMEEAHEFAPKERSGIGAENMAIFNAKKLATAGRSKGIRLMVLTQSVQQLHNRVLGSCDTMVAHRFIAPADQAPILKWLKANATKEIFDQVSNSLSQLKTGSAWVCSGEAKIFEQVHFQKISTYDNSKAPTNNDDVFEVKTAKVDTDKLRSIIGEAVEKAEADDPVKLRAAIADVQRSKDSAVRELESELDHVNRQLVEALAKPTIDEGLLAEVQEYLESHAEHVGAELLIMEHELAQATKSHSQSAQVIKDALSSLIKFKSASPAPNTQSAAAPIRPAPLQAPRVPDRASKATAWEGGGSQGLTGAQSKIVDALQFWKGPGIGQARPPTRQMVAAVAGYSAKSGGFRNLLSELHTAGIIAYPSPNVVSLTATGMRVGVAFTREEAKNRLISVMGQPAFSLVDQLRRQASPLSREDLAKRAGREPTSGGYRNLLSELHTIDVIDYPERGTVALTEWAANLLR